MDTLVLSHAFEPVARVAWQRAITLLFEGKVEVLEEYEDRTVRSVTLELKVPSIIRILRKIRVHRRRVKFSRENVYARDGGACQYCGRSLTRREATYDHVIPRSQGGPTGWRNVVIACTPCNQRKGGRTPAQAGIQLRTTPAEPTRQPDVVRLIIRVDEGAPESWRHWLRTYRYWNDELEQTDGEVAASGAPDSGGRR